MVEIKDGGPAFPTKYPALDPRASGFFTEDGMTLRDYFAAKAVQGLLANSEGAHKGQEPTLDALCRDKKIADTFAELAYDMADAMLRARGGQ